MTVMKLSINYKKARRAPHAEFYFRMMVAQNDFSSMRKLSGLADKLLDSNDTHGTKYSRVALVAYELRISISTVVESINTFVEQVRPTKAKPRGQHAVWTELISNPEVKANLKTLMKLVYSQPYKNGTVQMKKQPRGKEYVAWRRDFKRLRDIRNKICFHYDQNLTERALRLLFRVARNDGANFDECCMVADNVRAEERFPLADTLWTLAMMDITKIDPLKVDSNKPLEQNNKFAALQTYQGKVVQAFNKYAMSAVAAWLERYKLSPIKKKAKEKSV